MNQQVNPEPTSQESSASIGKIGGSYRVMKAFTTPVNEILGVTHRDFRNGSLAILGVSLVGAAFMTSAQLQVERLQAEAFEKGYEAAKLEQVVQSTPAVMDLSNSSFAPAVSPETNKAK